MTRVIQALIVAVAFAAAVLPIDSAAVERRYSTSIYPRIQGILTPASNLVPFALFDVLTVGAVVTLILAVAVAVSTSRQGRSFQPVRNLLFAIAAWAAAVYLIFLGVWGLNY